MLPAAHECSSVRVLTGAGEAGVEVLGDAVRTLSRQWFALPDSVKARASPPQPTVLGRSIWAGEGSGGFAAVTVWTCRYVVGKWSCLAAAGGTPRVGIRLGGWTRPPAQTPPLAMGGGGGGSRVEWVRLLASGALLFTV